MVIVPVASDVWMPVDRSHGARGCLMHAATPAIAVKYWGDGEPGIERLRSMPYRMSLATTARPFEYRIPRRNRNVYVLPSAEGRGSDVARSGTSSLPDAPPTRRKAIRPSLVVLASPKVRGP